MGWHPGRKNPYPAPQSRGSDPKFHCCNQLSRPRVLPCQTFHPECCCHPNHRLPPFVIPIQELGHTPSFCPFTTRHPILYLLAPTEREISFAPFDVHETTFASVDYTRSQLEPAVDQARGGHMLRAVVVGSAIRACRLKPLAVVVFRTDWWLLGVARSYCACHAMWCLVV